MGRSTRALANASGRLVPFLRRLYTLRSPLTLPLLLLVVVTVGGSGCSAQDDARVPTTASRTLASTQVGGLAAFATRELELATHADVTGEVAVRDAATNGQDVLRIGAHAVVTGDVRADRVRVASHARVAGQLTSNALDLHKKATLSLPPASPLSLPLADPTPPLPAVQPGAQDVLVASHSTVTLVAGAYGALLVSAGGGSTPTVLRLSGGVVQADRLELGAHARLECASRCELRLAGTLIANSHAFIGPPAAGSGSDLRIFVRAPSQGTIVGLGAHGTFVAQIIATAGELRVETHATVRGVLIARTIVVGAHAHVSAEGSLAGSDGGVADAARPDAAQPDAAQPDAALPDAAQADAALPDAAADAPHDAATDLASDTAPPCTSVDAAGGTVKSADGQATLVVPTGALTSSVCLSLIPAPNLPAAPLPAGSFGTAYTLEPAGTTFTSPASLRLAYDPSKLGSTAEPTLALARLQPSGWRVQAGSSVDLLQHTVSAPLGSIPASGENTFAVVPSVCGDGVISGLESCDGSVPAGQSCESMGYLGGTLVCRGDCTLDSSGCVSCTPTSCAAQGKDCGSIADGCGSTLSCGSCTAPQTCGGSGTPNVCGCAPTSCAAQGASCGSIADGCGGTLDCGTCTAPQTCGGGGTPNVCGCAPTSCAAQGATCGSIADGCGGTLDCGSCTAPQTCGGGGTANTCGCLPTTCAAQGKECGAISDGCGGTLDCGSCTAPQTCGGGGTANTCGCTPTTCAAQGKDCGTISDGCGGTLDCGGCNGVDLCGWGGSPNVCGTTLPPDPALVAPPIDQTVATTVLGANAFLYAGENPIQIGAVSSAFDAVRAALLRGRVLDASGNPQPGVSVRIVDQPLLGRTVTRADGRFDLVANGGGPLTLAFELSGYPTVHRQVNPRWQGSAVLDDIVLIPYDTAATTIASMAPTMQVHRASVVSDSDGLRQATLLFPAGTGATIKLADGSTQALSTLTVRATEYTVGSQGQARMPATLPPQVAYTYAVELSVDEAVAVAARTVELTQSALLYQENFLGFPTGTEVPLGSYDVTQTRWIPSASGRVVKVLSIGGGLAELDVDGSGVPASAATLAALGVSDEERQTLASLYTAGTSLWRMPIPHLSAWDGNCGWTGPEIAAPKEAETAGDGEGCPQTKASTVRCQGQVLSESVPVTGTPHALVYSSERVPGRETSRVKIFLWGADPLPTGLVSIALQVQIAGRRFAQTFTPAQDLSTVFTWDGLDALGRKVQGRQVAEVMIGYEVEAMYTSGGGFGSRGGGTLAGQARSREWYWIHAPVSIGKLEVASQGLGAWTLDAVHAYDPQGFLLSRGDGTQRAGAGGFNRTIRAHDYVQNASATDVTTDAEGSVYVGYAAFAQTFVRKITRNGTIVDYDAGQGRVVGVAVDAQKNIYVANYYGSIKRIDPLTHAVTTVAGVDGVAGYSGDGGPATSAHLSSPIAVAIDSSGNLYVADHGNYRVRMIKPDGVIETVAGTGVAGYSGDGGPATAAQLGRIWDLAVDAGGNLYIADNDNRRVRRVTPGGVINTVVGGAPYGCVPTAGVPALGACITALGVAVDRNGAIYINDLYELWRVGADGILAPWAGGGTVSALGTHGQPARAVDMRIVRATVDPAGAIYIASGGLAGYTNGWSGYSLYRIAPALPGLSLTDHAIVSRDGSELYRFDAAGRHLSTVDALTGATKLTITHDAAGRLSRLTDGDGNVTTVQRDAAGRPTAIVGPYGQQTALALDGAGYLASITDPAGQTHSATYDAGGLLTSLTKPRGFSSTYAYDALGRLTRDTDAGGGTLTLSHERPTTDHFIVTKTSAEGRETVYDTVYPASEGKEQSNTFPGGLTTTGSESADGTTTVTYADGTQVTQVQGPDPRWLMQAPLAKSSSVKLPSGLTRTVELSRAVTLANPDDPTSLLTQTDTVTVNGRTTTVAYDAATRTRTITSAAGRTRTLTLDTQGRVVRSEQPGLEPVTFVYDARGRLTTSTAGSGATARTSTYAYDVNGYLATVTDPLSRVTGFTYDAAGRTTKQTLPGARDVLFGYDAAGNTTSLTPPGRPAHGFDYTPIDLPASYTPPAVPGVASTTTSYAYNKDRQVTQLTRPDGQQVVFGYDTAGRVETLTSPLGVRTYAYDAPTGHLTSITRADGGALSYTWDGPLLTGTTWSGEVAGSVTQTYDSDFEVATQTAGGSTVSFTRDADRLLTGAGALTLTRDASTGFVSGTTLGTVTTTRTYDAFGAPATTTASTGGTGLYSTTYTRDALGRITQLDETVQGVTTSKVYSYDAAGRLWKVTIDGLPEAEYAYDANGNRLSVTDVRGTTTATYDAQDRLVTYGATTYAYTESGELTSKTDSSGTTTTSYDVYGQLQTVSLPDGTSITYVADGQNRRIGKKVNGTLVQGWLYEDQLRVVAELDGTGAVVSRFVYAEGVNVPAYMVKGGVTYRIVTDHLGSVRLVVDAATGTVAQQMDYDAWGVVTNDTAPGFQPFGYAGGLYDRHTGWVRFGARDYDPQIGRWTAKDPIGFDGGSENLYGYVLADPVNGMDPTGEQLFPAPAGFGPAASVCSTSGPSLACLAAIALTVLAKEVFAIEPMKCEDKRKRGPCLLQPGSPFVKHNHVNCLYRCADGSFKEFSSPLKNGVMSCSPVLDEA